MDERVEKVKTGIRSLKATRAVFAVAGISFSLVGIVVAFNRAAEVGVPAAVGIALVCSLFGFILGAGVWFVVGRFTQSAKDFAVKLHGPRFEEDLTGRTDHWDEVSRQNEVSPADDSSTPQLDLDVDLTSSVVVDDVEETLTLTAAHLFTQDDLRGNVDVVVSASPGESPDRLTAALLQHLQLGFDGRETRLEALAHQPNDPDGSFLVVLCYSVTDLIGEFDRPRLEHWIDELAASPGVVSVFWDDRLLGNVRLVVAD